MYFVEKQIQELEKTNYPLTREPDFDIFWQKALDRIAAHDVRPIVKLLPDYPLRHLRIYDVRVHGLDGTPVRAWLLMPEEASKTNKIPIAVYYHGGNGSRGIAPTHMLTYPYYLAGCAVLVSEFRLMGGLTKSATPMCPANGRSFITYNITEPPENYYLYHALTDQLLMVKFAMSLPEVNLAKVAVMGASGGGGTSLIMAGLEPKIALCLAGNPSFCCWERRVFTRTACAMEIARFIQLYPRESENVFRTLSYFDALNFAGRIRCRVQMQISLKDLSVPPECGFAAHNRITAPKDLKILPFHEHAVDWEKFLFDLAEHLVK
jgi:cephalosporin-C deacetylase